MTHFASLLCVSQASCRIRRSMIECVTQCQSLLCPLSDLCSGSQLRWIIHSYIKRSFPRRVVMFQQRSRHMPRGEALQSGQTLPPPSWFPTCVQVWREGLSSIGHLMRIIPLMGQQTEGSLLQRLWGPAKEEEEEEEHDTWSSLKD